MTATEELRRMLDERGVEWNATVGAIGTIWTHWDAFNGYRVHAMDNGDGTVEIFGEWDVTPEQAIDATLGANDARTTQAESSGTLTAEKVRELMKENSRQYPSPTDPYVWLTEYDWQAIADELNATLGPGTCEADETDVIKCWVKCKDEPSVEHMELIHVMECSACGGTYEYVNGSYEYCPNCGRKVVDE